MEQNPHNLKKIIDEIINAAPKQVVHVEDFFEVYRPSIRKFFAKLYCKSRDYQTYLYKILKEYEGKGRIQILNIDIARYNSPVSCHAFCRWKPLH